MLILNLSKTTYENIVNEVSDYQTYSISESTKSKSITLIKWLQKL